MIAQLSPLSRINFNLCSSAGVQGVLTLLFLTIVGGFEGDGAEMEGASGTPIEADNGGGMELESGLGSVMWFAMKLWTVSASEYELVDATDRPEGNVLAPALKEDSSSE